MLHNLPDELWLDIFDMAVDDSDFFEYTLPTVLSEASWFKNLYGTWSLRTAQEERNNAQRQSYATKKAIMNTCRNWRRLGYEFYYRFLFFSNPRNIHRLCEVMDTTKNLGKRTRRLHVARYFATGGTSSETIQNSLVSIIRHCPKLEIFITSWPLSGSFSPIANALCHYSARTLRVLQVNIHILHLPKLIFMLQCLPKLEVLHIEFEGPMPEYIALGAAGDLELNLPCLQHLTLRGPFQDFVEQAVAWHLPSLRLLSLDFVNYRDDLPDIIEFLTEHGQQLTFLDLNCIPALDVPTILDLCPLLDTFTFNPDWRLGALVTRPHAHLKTIGLHHLMYAFGVGYAATYNRGQPFVAQSIRRQNDATFTALNKRNFPRLERIRLLNPTLLTDLEKNNGPSQACFERWERWSKQCQRDNVRLEDCTGAALGTLPEVDEDEDEEDSVVGEGERHLSTLRELLMECRKMNAEREQEAYSPALHMIYAGE